MNGQTIDTGRFANMSADEILTEQARMLDRWAAEDAARRERNAAILASFDVR